MSIGNFLTKVSIIAVMYLLPLAMFAQVDMCSQDGFTVLTMNGVFTDKEGATENSFALKRKLKDDYQGEKIIIDYLHNPSHLAGVGDVLKAAYQKYFDNETVDDYDLREMLLSASQKVKTQKLLVVAHSQGNFYANSFYDSLADKDGGMPSKSLKVYGVATPSSRMTPGGKWLTSDTDKVIVGLVGKLPSKKILSPNTHIDLREGDDALGHNFSDVYLKYQGAKIVGDIRSLLDTLQIDESQKADAACIDPPKLGLTHKAQTLVFAAADPVAEVAVNTVSSTYAAGTSSIRLGFYGLSSLAAVLKNTFSNSFGQNQNVAGVAGLPLETNAPAGAGATEPAANAEEGGEANQAENAPAIVNVPDGEVNNEEESAGLPEVPAILPLVLPPVALPQFVVTPGFGGGGGGAGQSQNSQTSNSTPAVILPAPVDFAITEPSDLSQTFNTTTIIFKGTSSNNAEIETDIGFDTIADSSGVWELPITFAEGTTTMSMWAEVEGRESEKETFDVFVDSLSPDLAFEISECDNSLAGDECLLAVESEINLSWSSTEANIFEINLNGTVSQTSATSTTFDITADGVYNFSVAVEDSAGNKTEKEISVQKIATPVVINEVGWAGTSASPSDEWIELYNRSNKSINLNNFVLVAADGTPNIVLQGEIAAGAYFLLERGDDDVISDVPAGLIYGSGESSLALNNNGEEMLLKIGTTVIDRTPPVRGAFGCSNWCGGESSGRISMERLNAEASGYDYVNWASSMNEFLVNGHDKNGRQVNGTPGKSNSSPRLVATGGVLAANKTLTAANSPYLIERFGLIIGAGVTLTIEEGVVIKFVIPNEPALTLDGKLVARGSAANPVVFTAYFDDEYGGDTDGAPCDPATNTNCPLPGSWKHINARSGSELDLEHTIVRYGGKWFNGYQPEWRTMLRAEDAVVRLINSTIELSKRHGLFAIDSTLEIRGTTFRKMNTDAESQAINIYESTAVIENPEFSQNFADIAGGDSMIECINCGTPITNPADLLQNSN